MIVQLELSFQLVAHAVLKKQMTHQEAKSKLEEFREMRYRAINNENWTAKIRIERRMSELLEEIEEMEMPCG